MRGWLQNPGDGAVRRRASDRNTQPGRVSQRRRTARPVFPHPGHPGRAQARPTSCYVAVEAATARLAGYYTLSAAHVALNDLPEALAKHLPRHPTVPVARLGRLAVDGEYRGQKLGAALLWDAAARAARSEMAVFALLVDAKDDQAEAFYRHHGFVPFGRAAGQLVLAVVTFAAGIGDEVPAAHTSQTCAECGVVDIASRLDQARFVCGVRP